MLVKKTIKHQWGLFRWVRRYKRISKDLIYSDRYYLCVDTPTKVNNEEED